jgi:integrase
MGAGLPQSGIADPLQQHGVDSPACVAVEAGVVYSNAAAVVRRAPVRRQEIVLPSIDKFNALIAEMRAGHSRDSINCADFAAGLAFTGCGIGEAREIAWRDVDFDAGEIVVRGDAETGTKNWELRRVPLIPDARALFQRMRSERPDEERDKPRQGIAANTLNLHRNGAVGFIDRLDRAT